MALSATETLAVVVRLEAAALDTLASTVTTGELVPAAKTSPRWQDTVWALTVQV